ncbi:MBL fold metallo-hydrolase [Umezawaea beigongshangensis]|uniref:MBL fold metallo-hydrolase n=1 Tax=Umezawaea beigongshangensis TaxID=2780383 RepID=UPI0018F11760|nr:MBL fold metallo-hydrolase [Umezawaea beigongshangensis]
MTDSGSASTLTFVGTATTILRLGGFTLLTDPNFLHRGQRAYLGWGLSSKRLTEPAMQPGDLPPLDGLVLSHLHGDHFDRVARRSLPRDLPVVTTKQAARRLSTWGFGSCDALDTWQSHVFERPGERVRVTAVPGVHGPGPVDRLLPRVMGSVLELERDGEPVLRLYITGDTLYRPWLREVAERFPGIDVMVAHLGGTRIAGVLLTMDGKQGASLVELIRPSATVPIHHDDYGVMRSPLSDFQAEAQRRGLSSVLRPVARGETIALRP